MCSIKMLAGKTVQPYGVTIRAGQVDSFLDDFHEVLYVPIVVDGSDDVCRTVLSGCRQQAGSTCRTLVGKLPEMPSDKGTGTAVGGSAKEKARKYPDHQRDGVDAGAEQRLRRQGSRYGGKVVRS